MTDEQRYIKGAILQYRFGWVVRCPICGKRTERKFLLRDHADPRMSAERYWQEHLASPDHSEGEES